MGTLVLSSQDCLSSPHNRQNYNSPSARRPETGRRCSQALMAPLPVAEDCGRHDFSGGSPPGNGLLPIPQTHRQARDLTKRPVFPTKSSSILSSPPSRRIAAASQSPTVKSNLSRSASAILPTPLTGSPPSVEGTGPHLLKGRLPFKIVQGNGPGTKFDVVQRNNSKKSNDTKNGAQKKMAGSTGHAINAKVKGRVDGLQGSRLTLKPPLDAGFWRGQSKKADVIRGRFLERSYSVQGTDEKYDQECGTTPIVTILQRPQSKEAAAELLTKFFQKSTEQENECVDISENTWNCHEMTKESEIKQHCSIEGLSDFGAYDRKACQTVSSPWRKTDLLGAVTFKRVEGSPVADASSPAVSCTLVSHSSSSKGTFEDLMLESVGEDLAPWERWAGPSFINSPPPSALPLPRFSKKPLKIESSAAANLFEEIVSDRASMLPSSISPLDVFLSGCRQLGANSDVTSSATKDLKRIPNLDLCRM